MFAVYLARIRLLLGVYPHVRQQFVLGVERRQLPGAILQITQSHASIVVGSVQVQKPIFT